VTRCTSNGSGRWLGWDLDSGVADACGIFRILLRNWLRYFATPGSQHSCQSSREFSGARLARFDLDASTVSPNGVGCALARVHGQPLTFALDTPIGNPLRYLHVIF
jgi:hypothetical protein